MLLPHEGCLDTHLYDTRADRDPTDSQCAQHTLRWTVVVAAR
jgi:hypothetical protein